MNHLGALKDDTRMRVLEVEPCIHFRHATWQLIMTRDLETGLLWIQKGVQECRRLVSSHQLFNIQMTYMHHVCPCFHSSQKDLCFLKLQECPTLLGGSTCSPRPATATFGVGQDEIVVGGRHRGEAGNFSHNSTSEWWFGTPEKTRHLSFSKCGWMWGKCIFVCKCCGGGHYFTCRVYSFKKRHWNVRSFRMWLQILRPLTPNLMKTNIPKRATSPGVPDAGKTTLLREA